MLLLVFFSLTVIDSVSTLIYLGKGGRELNPIAQWMIDQGSTFFVVLKGVLSGVCLLFVMLHKNGGWNCGKALANNYRAAYDYGFGSMQ